MARPVSLFRCLLAAESLALGCNRSPSTGAQADSRSAAEPKGSPFRLSKTPILDLGGPTSTPGTDFTSPTPLYRFPDGRFVILDFESREIRVFDSTGRFMKLAARSGDGPGEISRLMTMKAAGLVADSVAILLEGTGQVYVFDSSMKFIRASSITRPGSALDGRSLIFRDGSVLVESRPRSPPCANEVRTYHTNWARVRDTATVVARFDSFFSHQANIQKRDNSCLEESAWRPWASVATDGDRLFYAAGEKAEIQLFDRSGTLIRTLRWPESPLRFSDPRVEGWFDGLGPEGKAGVVRQMGTPPEFVPAISTLRIDGFGNVWAAESANDVGGGVVWNVVDSTGVYLGKVVTPKNFEVYGISQDYVMGLFRDEDEALHVQLYRLSKAP